MSVMTPPKYSHVEITDGIVQKSSINGWPDPTNVGEYRFFVTLVEADQAFEELWDGPSYEQAILEAETLGRDYSVPVLDLIQGRPA